MDDSADFFVPKRTRLGLARVAASNAIPRRYRRMTAARTAALAFIFF